MIQILLALGIVIGLLVLVLYGGEAILEAMVGHTEKKD